MVTEYRVNRKGSSQGHYVLAKNRYQAIKSVKNKHESFSDFNCTKWKVGRSKINMKMTPKARRGAGLEPRRNRKRKYTSKADKIIKEWNNGKVPKSLKGNESLLRKVKDELGSGYHAPHPSRVKELRTMKGELQKRVNKGRLKKARKQKTQKKKQSKASKKRYKQKKKEIKVGDKVKIGSGDVMSYHQRYIGDTGTVTRIAGGPGSPPTYTIKPDNTDARVMTWDVNKVQKRKKAKKRKSKPKKKKDDEYEYVDYYPVTSGFGSNPSQKPFKIRQKKAPGSKKKAKPKKAKASKKKKGKLPYEEYL